MNRPLMMISRLSLLLLLTWSSTHLLRPGEHDASRQGWQGETMPEGLIKGEKEGEYIWTRNGSVMVYVPGGTGPMGSAQGEKDEQPVRQVHLDPYYIDKYETTIDEWRAAGLPDPEEPAWGWKSGYPVVFVSWRDIQPYLEKVGKRLPTEAEWERAARGLDGRDLPWGEGEPSVERVIWRGTPWFRIGAAPVNCCPDGASPYGAENMLGNVYEWCQDWYRSDFYQVMPDRNPVNQEVAKHRVLRGGSWVHDLRQQRAGYRYRLLPIDRTPYIGFRTALSGLKENR